MSKSPIQTPMSFSLLRWFGIPRNVEDAIGTLNGNVQPVIDVSCIQQVENIVTGNVDPLALALGFNTIISNNSQQDLLAVWSADCRVSAALGAGFTTTAFIAYRAQPGPGTINPTIPLSDRLTFTTGDVALWGFMAKADSPVILLPGESVGLWVTTLTGGGYNTFGSSRTRVLTS